MKIVIVLVLMLGLACSKKEEKIPRDIMLSKAMAYDPNLKIVIPSNIKEGVHCTDYGPGCIGGHTVIHKRLPLIVVEFATEADARNEAIRLKQYYSKNWLFDDVKNEPPLEKFIIDVYQAVSP